MHLGRGPAFGIVCAGKWAVSGEVSQIDLHFVTGRATGKHIRHRYPFLTSNWFPSLAWGGVGWGGVAGLEMSTRLLWGLTRIKRRRLNDNTEHYDENHETTALTDSRIL